MSSIAYTDREFPFWSAAATHQPTAWDLLNAAHQQIQRGAVFEGMSMLYIGLYGHRRALSAAEWLEFCARARTEHELRDIVYQSPLTRRAFEKPRGYAGDAEMIDLIYGYGAMPSNVTPLGADIYNWELQAPGPKSVRARRQFLASLIDFVSTLVQAPRVCSIACGHVRELELSTAVRDGRLGAFVALDQDTISLSTVASAYGSKVTPVHSSVRKLLTDSSAYKEFDLVYASGLFDYLPHDVGTQLMSTMFEMLRPGGRVLIANFAPEMLDIGYMDTFMDWRLLYRTERETADLAVTLPEEQVFSRRVFRDPGENCIFLEVVRK